MADHETTRYIGLADDKGMEYFHPEADASDGASPWGFSLLNMRASLNRHRNATAFAADLYAFEAEEINNDMKKGNFHAAVGTLKDALAARAGSVLLARGTSKYWDAVHGTTVTLSPGDIAPPDRADADDAAPMTDEQLSRVAKDSARIEEDERRHAEDEARDDYTADGEDD